MKPGDKVRPVNFLTFSTNIDPWLGYDSTFVSVLSPKKVYTVEDISTYMRYPTVCLKEVNNWYFYQMRFVVVDDYRVQEPL